MNATPNSVSNSLAQRSRYAVDNHDGWLLSLFQAVPTQLKHPRPVLIVPGYGMNSFIFSYHPRGLSLEAYLVERGFEVWRIDLRGQGESHYQGPGAGDNFRLDDLAVTDLSAAVAFIRDHSVTGAKKVDVLGASLGGTLMFAHAALVANHHLGALVALGSPVRWVSVHPLLRVLALSPDAVGKVRLRSTRTWANRLVPALARYAPKVLSPYVNPDVSDLTKSTEILRTIEDPNPWINRQIAYWIRARDLILRGTNLSVALGRLTQPVLSILARYDGLVPEATARFAHDQLGSTDKTLVELGSPTERVAHADLFVWNQAQTQVFAPIASFLGRVALAA